MNHSLVITALGPDKPGLVRTLSEIIADNGESWQESRMVRLAGQFAGVVKVDAPSENLDGIVASLESGIPELVIHTAKEGHSEITTNKTIQLKVTGNDRPGIVRELSSAIASCGANVEELATGPESAAMSGYALFLADCTVSIPEGVEVETVIQAVENLSSDLTADITE